MWVFTKSGFLSIVKHRYMPGRLMIRARVREDIEQCVGLLDEIAGSRHQVKETPDGDYRFRVTARKETVAEAIARLTTEIGYDNFKNAVHGDPARDRAYMGVWSAMHGLQTTKLRGDNPSPGFHSFFPELDDTE